MLPAYTLTVTELLSPVVIPATPLNAGVPLASVALFAGAVSVTTGAVVSTTNVCAALAPVLLAASTCVACAVYVPAASAGDPSIVHVPPLRVATRVCTGEPVTTEPL